ncbi:MAG TPA: hypothetical protein VMS38_04835 [Pseudorhodoferax sp.]|nr:hypothetical protein [Pseudorhodoferax sp.]
MVETYFQAERTHGLLFMAVGVVMAGLAVWGWRQAALWRGAAWPLIAIAAIQLLVGASLWWRSPQDSLHVQHAVQTDSARTAGEEIPRMQAVMQNFRLLRRVELGLLAVGIVLLLLCARGSAWQGAGLGLVVQVGLVMALDAVAERRGAAYLAWLQSL